MNDSKLKTSILLRMFLVATQTLLLLIPTAIVESLINERSQRRDSAISEVSEKWGAPQTITGPILTIPLKRTVQDDKGKETVLVDNLNILPDSLAIQGELTTEVRYRGIYEAILYNGNLKIAGTLNIADIPQLDQVGLKPQWNGAFLTIGISDLRGIKEDVWFIFNDAPISAHAGVQSDDLIRSGITILPRLDPALKKYAFQFSLNLNGSSELHFTPLGKHTEVSLKSSWTSPSFAGAFLPDRREIDQHGFSAHWSILELNRNFPQHWINNRHDVSQSTFGVRLLQTVDEYQKTVRTAQYAILIIALTFLAFFLCEVLSPEVLHPIHYSLIGLSLVLFYLLVLSFSEHFGFDLAYLLSALAVLILISMYSKAVTSQSRTSSIVGVVLLALYAFLYVVLQIEDYALIIGSVGLLLILAIVMYLTRKVDWFSVSNGEKK